MGCGKSSAAINHIRYSPANRKFLYITPQIDEVQRIIDGCPEKNIEQPKKFGTKLKGITYLLQNGKNISSTHALFRKFDEEMVEYIQKYEYTLILDEVSEVIKSYDMSEDDLQTLLEKYVRVDDKGILHWEATDYDGRFSDCKELCDLGCLGLYGSRIMLWLFPVSVFEAFKEVFILTYLFPAQIQKYYFDMYDVTYQNIYVAGSNPDNFTFTDQIIEYPKMNYQNLIHICEDEKLNAIGSSSESALSLNWYEKRASEENLLTLKNNIYNYFFNRTNTKSKDNLWTTFNDYEDVLSGKGYAKGFLYHTARATNSFRHKRALAYGINKFMNYAVRNFFVAKNISVDEDSYALSEMLQWIWRSQIRDGKEIWIYIPSKRMRSLLQTWIAENSTDTGKCP